MVDHVLQGAALGALAVGLQRLPFIEVALHAAHAPLDTLAVRHLGDVRVAAHAVAFAVHAVGKTRLVDGQVARLAVGPFAAEALAPVAHQATVVGQLRVVRLGVGRIAERQLTGSEQQQGRDGVKVTFHEGH